MVRIFMLDATLGWSLSVGSILLEFPWSTSYGGELRRYPCKLYSQEINPQTFFQIVKFLGGDSKPLQLDKDSTGSFVTSLDVDQINDSNGETFGCQPSPGEDAEVKVHVITEGKSSFENQMSNDAFLKEQCWLFRTKVSSISLIELQELHRIYHIVMCLIVFEYL